MLQSQPLVSGKLPSTPIEQTCLNLLLLDSSSPDSTKLYAANILLNLTLKRVENLPSPT